MNEGERDKEGERGREGGREDIPLRRDDKRVE
jgi:hypothetical protein